MHDTVRIQTLLSAVARQDEKAFASLYACVSPNLFAVALRILKSNSLAEDVIQDAFIKIWHKAGDYHASKGSPMVWMATIARNRALDVIRQQKRRPADDIDDYEIESDEAGPLSDMIDASSARELLDCMDELNESQRNSLLLAYYDGLTHEELASRIAKPLGTIKSWIRRGLLKIRECLER